VPVKRSRFIEEQIAFALKQAETGTAVLEVCRKMGLSEQTYYRWKKQYGGLGVLEIKRLKLLEEENHRRLEPGQGHAAGRAGNNSEAC
jgi:putative transposase